MQNPFSGISQHKSLSRLLIAQIPADFADWLDFVAIGTLLAFSWNAEPMAFALLAVAMGLPYLLIGMLAGAIVDRSDLRTVMIASNIARAVATVSLAFAGSITALLIIVFLRSTVDAFYSPAKQASIQALAPSETLMQVNGLSHAINQASKIAGPAVGGVLLLFLAPENVFFINAIVSIIAATVLFRLPKGFREVAGNSDGKPSVFADIRAGFATVNNDHVLLMAILLMAGGFFAMFFYDTMFPLLTAALSLNETAFALAIASVGAGGIIGALAIGAITPTRPFLLIGISAILSGTLVMALGFFATLHGTLSLNVFLALFAVIGFASAAMLVPFKTILQQQAEPEMIARITALSEAINVTAMLTAPFIGAAIATIFSVGVSFVTGGILGIAVGVMAVVISLKTVERR